MSGFKASKSKLTFILGADAAGDFQYKCMLIYHLKNPRALRNYAMSILPVLYKCNKDQMAARLFITWFTGYLKPIAEMYCSEKKTPFETLLLIDNSPGHLRA